MHTSQAYEFSQKTYGMDQASNHGAENSALTFVGKTIRDIDRMLIGNKRNKPEPLLTIMEMIKDTKERAALLEKLESCSYEIRYMFAISPETHPEILHVLAKDTSSISSIRVGVAKNPNTWPETLKILARDHDCSVRSAVPQNASTLIETLEVLISDTNKRVASIAKEARGLHDKSSQ